jgi:mono/diheme cytochrome c family protein
MRAPLLPLICNLLSVLRLKNSIHELCAACHGSHARGAVGPDLTTSRFKYGKSRAAIEKSILDGRPGGMPAFGSYLKLEEVKTLADYLLTLQ